MLLHLTPRTNVRELKKQFAVAFPFLKLAFARAEKSNHGDEPLQEALQPDVLLSDITADFHEGGFYFSPDETVADFEHRLYEEHGLPVQVLRKSQGLWRNTAGTPNLTLTRQNQLGNEAIHFYRVNSHTLFL